MICQYVNQGETHLSLTTPYELVKGSDSSKETFRTDLKTEFPGLPAPWHFAIVSQASENITAGCPLIANQGFERWDKFKKSFDTAASPEMTPNEGHCSKESHIEQRRRPAPQCIGGKKAYQDGKQSSPLGR